MLNNLENQSQLSLTDQFPLEPKEEADVKVYSVSELNNQIKKILEGKFNEVWIKAEISNFKAHTSGHFYFSLKDQKCQVAAVMFKGVNSKLKFRPEDGMEVLVRGRVSVYEPRGSYQIYCEMMEPVGAGALQIAFDQLKAKLQSEGLFDPRRKRPIPVIPHHLAIVTSPTGAAIRDMLNVLARRFKGLKITVVPTKVQGTEAAGEIVEALHKAQQLPDVDVIIVGRGGGSIEDLWSFNEEIVARAVANCRVPIISGVGHEIDFTICDFVADLRAPTPSAAAELVVKNAGDLSNQVERIKNTLTTYLKKHLAFKKQHVDSYSRRLVDPKRYLQDVAVKIDDYLERLRTSFFSSLREQHLHVKLLRQKMGSPKDWVYSRRQELEHVRSHLEIRMESYLQERERRWTRFAALLDGLSPLKVVARGYSLVKKGEVLIKNAADLAKGETVEIQFARGKAQAKIEEIDEQTNINKG